MAFFNEFPHTRTYDSDLGWIIKKMAELIVEWGGVEEAWEEFKKQFSDKLTDSVNSILDEWLKDGTLNILIQKWVELYPFLSVKDYGAKGDGITDDSDAFMSWYNDLAETGKTGIIPNGTYLLNKNPTYRGTGKISFFGEDINKVVLKKTAGISLNIIDLRNCKIGEIGNFTIDLNGEVSDKGGTGIYLVNVNNSASDRGLLHDINIKNVSYCGILLYSSNSSDRTYNLDTIRCTIEGNTTPNNDGIHPAGMIYENCQYCNIIECVVNNVIQYGIEYKDYCRYCSMRDCTVINSNNGFYFGGDADLENDPTVYCRECSITNCKSLNALYHIVAGKVTNITIDGIICSGSKAVFGLYIQHSSNVKINGILFDSFRNAVSKLENSRYVTARLTILESTANTAQWFSQETHDNTNVFIIDTTNSTAPKLDNRDNVQVAILSQSKWFGAEWKQNPT